MNEQKFSAWLRSRLPGHTQRIESTVGTGIPDFVWCHEGHVVWVETKIVEKRQVLLRPMQYAWGMRWNSNEGTCLVVAYDNDEEEVLIYDFPLRVKKHGKYLAIQGMADLRCDPKQFKFSLLRLLY